MNRILFRPHEREGDFVMLRDHRARHIRQVLRLNAGDQMRVGEINGLCGVGQVQELERDAVKLQVHLEAPPPPPSRVQVLLALPRPKACGRILESLTELGVKKIVLLQAAKVEKSYWQAHQLRRDQVEKHLLMGLAQSGDTVLPEVEMAPRFRPFVEDELRTWMGTSEGWVLHPSSGGEALPQHWAAPTTLAIGPEGGWVDFEVALLREQGFRVGTWGPRILSSETAVSLAGLGSW